jgi:hypothetical protein
MSQSINERAVFQSEVAEVEQWWKVCSRFPLHHLSQLTRLIEPPLRSCKTSLHRGTSCVQTGDDSDLLPLKHSRQEALGNLI